MMKWEGENMGCQENFRKSSELEEMRFPSIVIVICILAELWAWKRRSLG